MPLAAARPPASHPEPAITDEFAAAFALLENTRQNVFLTGKAGTGKSTFLQYFREYTGKNIAVVAPTGVAALNVQGQTIHSLFRLKPGFVDIARIRPDRRKLFRELELLIIDEISMVRADVFEGINHALKLARKNQKPFGGVQLCIIGDLFQLPPVITSEEKEFFAQYYNSPFFFAAEAYAAGEFKTIQFNTIHRQSDSDFIGILNAIRSGACDAAKLESLNKRVSLKAVPAPGTLVLTSTNALADNINSTQLAKLHTKPQMYEGEFSGEFGLKGPRLPAAQTLALKAGAQVMFVKNDPAGRWVNGTVGMIADIGSNSITVKVHDSFYDVEREKWQTIAFEYNEEQGKIVEKTLGTYTQFPLTLAWAITIHKAQGKTLERAIIDLGHGAFAAGQLYVALSRCKSLHGIALKQPVTQKDIRCDEQVVAFMNNATEDA